jgi:hypothetical protein
MTSRIGSIRSEPDLRPDPSSTLPTFPPSTPPAPGDGPLQVDESLWNFIEASRVEQKSSKLAQLGGVVPSPRDVDADRGANIRAYFGRFNIEVAVQGGAPGETRRVAVPFRIAPNAFDDHVKNLRQALGSSPSKEYVGLVVAGRATPEQLSAVVNELARLHPEQFATDRSAEDVRNYLRQNGVGIDCAGSVQLALLHLKGLSSNQGPKLGLRQRLDEDLTSLRRSHFQKLPNPSALRAGDLIILRPPENDKFGHTVIVTQTTAGAITSAEAATLSRQFPDLATPGKEVLRIGVASSFGWEGPQERTWIFDPSTGQWGDLGGNLFDGDGAGHSTSVPGRHSGPWDHKIDGMYHAY